MFYQIRPHYFLKLSHFSYFLNLIWYCTVLFPCSTYLSYRHLFCKTDRGSLTFGVYCYPNIVLNTKHWSPKAKNYIVSRNRKLTEFFPQTCCRFLSRFLVFVKIKYTALLPIAFKYSSCYYQNTS
jgi:hypothetical protein